MFVAVDDALADELRLELWRRRDTTCGRVRLRLGARRAVRVRRHREPRGALDRGPDDRGRHPGAPPAAVPLDSSVGLSSDRSLRTRVPVDLFQRQAGEPRHLQCVLVFRRRRDHSAPRSGRSSRGRCSPRPRRRPTRARARPSPTGVIRSAQRRGLARRGRRVARRGRSIGTGPASFRAGRPFFITIGVVHASWAPVAISRSMT